MLNFEHANPTQIVFGAGGVSRLPELLPPDARVLVLSGRSSARRYGTLDAVEATLSSHAVEHVSGIGPHPEYDELLPVVQRVQRGDIDWLLAVGGGSVIDAAKFVAAAAHYPVDPWHILETGGQHVRSALPIGVVLTLAATGSESNDGAVISRRALRAKRVFASPWIYPRFAVLDPTLTYSLPAKQIANGVVDAYVHVLEQYLTYPVGAALQDRYAQAVLTTLLEQGPLALEQPSNYGVRANLMWASNQALNGWIGVGVPQDWSSHQIGHVLSALYGLDHAQTLAIVMPALLSIRAEQKREKLLQYARCVWGLSGDDAAETAVTKTREFFESLGIATRLRDYGLGPDAIAQVLSELASQGITALGERADIDLTVSRRILEAAL